MKTNSILYYQELKTEEKNNSIIVWLKCIIPQNILHCHLKTIMEERSPVLDRMKREGEKIGRKEGEKIGEERGILKVLNDLEKDVDKDIVEKLAKKYGYTKEDILNSK